MGTVVELRVIGASQSRISARRAEHAMEAAAGWFERVEQDCSRFDPASELRRLCATVERPVVASPLLFSAIHFAVAVARETNGAFDPTIGAAMERLGFARHHRTGVVSRSSGGDATWQDVALDDATRSVTLLRPLTLDLGAVAKGLAIDLAARELAPLANFAIDAGGDLYLGGMNAEGEAWSVGIRHPRGGTEPIDRVRVSDRAVCTSGDYERKGASGKHHLVDPRSGSPATHAASVTAIGASAMVADALGTAAFILGPGPGIDLLERHGLEGLIVDAALQRHASAGWEALRS
jgi:thiamine biosynthesis lipoprotein